MITTTKSFHCKACGRIRGSADSLRFHVQLEHLGLLANEPEFRQQYLAGGTDPQTLFCFQRLVRDLTRTVVTESQK
jgi:hypothetical protein